MNKEGAIIYKMEYNNLLENDNSIEIKTQKHVAITRQRRSIALQRFKVTIQKEQIEMLIDKLCLVLTI